MKRAFYIFCFTLLGALLAFLVHVLVELAATWPFVACALTTGLFAFGIGWGYCAGVKFWNIIYVEKRYGWPPKWDRKFRKNEGSRT